MLIEILGNSSSLLVILLIGLSIYFGIQSKTKNIKWWFNIFIIAIGEIRQNKQQKIKSLLIQVDSFLFPQGHGPSYAQDMK